MMKKNFSSIFLVCLFISPTVEAKVYCQPRSTVCAIIDKDFCNRARAELRAIESSYDYQYVIKYSHGDKQKAWKSPTYRNAMSFRAGLEIGRCKGVK
jgi:hypothetical protein